MVRCVAIMQKRGKLRADVPPDQLAQPLFWLKYMLFTRNIANDAASMADYEKQLKDAVKLMVEGLSPQCH